MGQMIANIGIFVGIFPLYLWLDVQIDAQCRLRVDDRPAASRVDVLYAFLVATLHELIDNSIAAISDGKAQVVDTIAVLVDELLVGTWIVVEDLVQLDHKPLRSYDRGELQSELIVLAIVQQVRVGGIDCLMHTDLRHRHIENL